MLRRRDLFWYVPDDGGGAPADDNGGTDRPAPLTFEAWLEKQDDATKTLITGHITGLRNTVTATRSERDAMAAKLSDITKALGKNNAEDAKRLVEELTSQIETANRRAAFAEEAIKPEIGCVNPKAAFLLASADNLFTHSGAPDWSAIKAAAPELFRAQQPPPPPGHAGHGAGQTGPATGMNAFIRRAAGRE